LRHRRILSCAPEATSAQRPWIRGVPHHRRPLVPAKDNIYRFQPCLTLWLGRLQPTPLITACSVVLRVVSGRLAARKRRCTYRAWSLIVGANVAPIRNNAIRKTPDHHGHLLLIFVFCPKTDQYTQGSIALSKRKINQTVRRHRRNLETPECVTM